MEPKPNPETRSAQITGLCLVIGLFIVFFGASLGMDYPDITFVILLYLWVGGFGMATTHHLFHFPPDFWRSFAFVFLATCTLYIVNAGFIQGAGHIILGSLFGGVVLGLLWLHYFHGRRKIVKPQVVKEELRNTKKKHLRRKNHSKESKQ